MSVQVYNLTNEQVEAYLLASLSKSTASTFAKLLILEKNLYMKIIELLYFEKIFLSDIDTITDWSVENITSLIDEWTYKFDAPVILDNSILQNIPNDLISTYGLSKLMGMYTINNSYYNHNLLRHFNVFIKITSYTTDEIHYFRTIEGLKSVFTDTIIPLIRTKYSVASLNDLLPNVNNFLIDDTAQDYSTLTNQTHSYTFFSTLFNTVFSQYLTDLKLFDETEFYKVFCTINNEVCYLGLNTKLSKGLIDFHSPTEIFYNEFLSLCYKYYNLGSINVNLDLTFDNTIDFSDAFTLLETHITLYVNFVLSTETSGAKFIQATNFKQNLEQFKKLIQSLKMYLEGSFSIITKTIQSGLFNSDNSISGSAFTIFEDLVADAANETINSNGNYVISGAFNLEPIMLYASFDSSSENTIFSGSDITADGNNIMSGRFE
jgi:hypothetical protein